MGNGRRRDPHRRGARLAVLAWCAGLLCAAVLVAGCGGSHRTNPRPQGGSVVIGHGTTAAGDGYTVWLEAPRLSRGAPPPLPPAGFSGQPVSCPMMAVMTVRAGGFGGSCLTPAVSAVTTTANCAGGFVTVTALTPPGAGSGRLLMSDGRTIVSPVYSVPHGGSRTSGFFFQIVRGPKPVPVSVTISDRTGRAVATARFPRIVGCTANPIHYLPGGLQPLVRGRSSRGVRFAIFGLRYRFLGRVYFCLQPTSYNAQPRVPGPIPGPAGGASSQSCPDQQPGPLAPDVFVSCMPAPLELVYGLLRDAHDRIDLRSGGKRIATKRAPIPAALHAHGELFYAETHPGPVTIGARAPLGATPLQTYAVPANPCASGAAGVGVMPQSPSAKNKR